MPSAREWCTYIKVFSALIILGGILGIISAFVGRTIEFGWGSLVLGIMYICVGARGFHAANHHCVRDARQYFVGLIVIIIMNVIISVINIAVNETALVQNYCDAYVYVDCASFGTMILWSSVATLIIGIAICICCAACARAYYHALLHEEHHGAYNPVATTVVTYQAPVYAQPPVYQPAPVYQSAPAYAQPTQYA